MLLLGVGYLGLFGLWLIRGVVSGGCSSGHREGVCLVSGVRLTLHEGSLESGEESRRRANVGEEVAGSVPEKAGAPGVRSTLGKGVYTRKGGIGNRSYGFCV